MLRFLALASGIAAVALATGCGLFPDLGGLSSDGGESLDASDATVPNDAGADAADAAKDSAVDAPVADAKADAADAASCSCPNLVSAYRFDDANNLGHDFMGNNNMTSVSGTPKQSTTTPSGFAGYSIQVDGASTVCITTGYTFDTTADHTLCWWSQPTALADGTNQFAQACGYDTWTANSGVDYLWRINNCNGGTPANLQVPNAYSANTWTQICQTYKSSALQRTVVLNGNTSNKFSVTDTVPIVNSQSTQWCIGAYGSGGFWTGFIYKPMWFNRILTDTEIQEIHANTGCCIP